MSERRSSTICAVVKRPDHHCGDDLVHHKCQNIGLKDVSFLLAVRVNCLILLFILLNVSTFDIFGSFLYVACIVKRLHSVWNNRCPPSLIGGLAKIIVSLLLNS